MESLPSAQLGLFIANSVPEYTLSTHAVPTAGPGEVLVKVEAVALNPTDWKLIAFGIAQVGNGVGNDFSGTVVALGKGTHDVSIGDRVAGRKRAGFDKKHFAFQQYLTLESDLLIKIPDTMSFEEAATVPLTGMTAMLGLHRLVDFPRQSERGKTLLVCGGSSCVGMHACQLAQLVGLRVIATASPKNSDLVRSLGVESVIDYHAPDALQQILDAAGPCGVDVVFDVVSNQDSVRLASDVLKANPQGQKKAVIVVPVNPAALDPAFQFHTLSINSIYDEAAREYDVARAGCKSVPRWLEQGKLKPSPVVLKPGGLDGIEEGVALLKAGKVSASKLVYRIADTLTPSP